MIGAGGAVGQAGRVRNEDCQRYGFSGVSWKHGDWDWWEIQPRWCASYYDDSDGDGDGIGGADFVPIHLAAQNHYMTEYKAGRVRP